MAIFLKISAAILLGVYSSLGLHFYSVIVSRIKNEAVRFLLFLAAIALFIVGPLFNLAGQHFKRPTGNLTIILTPCWIGVVLLYLVLNWRAFNERLASRG